MVYIRVDNIVFEMGTGASIESVFFSIAHHLESREWGSKYPVIMNELYYNGIEVENLNQALAEIRKIKEELKEFAPEQIVWNYDNPTQTPPWGDDIPKNVSNLFEYFESYDGLIIDIIIQVIEMGIELSKRVYFQSINIEEIEYLELTNGTEESLEVGEKRYLKFVRDGMFYINTNSLIYEIGFFPILNSMFYTIAHHLENRGWGSKYPVIMLELFNDGIEVENLQQGLREIKEIKENLKNYSPQEVVWDYFDLSIMPPWKDNITEDITNLSNYFLSPYDRNNILETIQEAIEWGIKWNSKVFFEFIKNESVTVDKVKVID